MLIILTFYTFINLYYLITLGLYPPTDGDAHLYYSSALSIVNGQGFSYRGLPAATFPPGYPVFLSAIIYIFGQNVLFISVIQILLGYILIFIMVGIVKRYTKNIYLIVLPALLYVLNYKIMTFNSLTMTESFSGFLIILILYLLLLYVEKNNKLILILLSALFGFLVITRPAYLYLLIPFEIILLILLTKKKNWKLLVDIPISIIILFIIIFPVIKRGHDLFGDYKIVFQGGGNLYCGTNVETDGLRSLRVDNYIYTEREEDLTFFPEEIFQQIKGKGINEKDEILKKAAIKNMYQNGLSAVPLYLKNFSRVMFGYPYMKPFWNRQFVLIYYYFMGIMSMFAFLVSLFYIVKYKVFKDIFISALILFALYNMMFHFLVAFEPRYGFTTYIIIYTIIPFGLCKMPILNSRKKMS
jgi:4-amino-4-deoxy-L-arabinose transferase-like glycosyltransferase